MRDGTTTSIVVATNALGKQDAHHRVRVTENPIGSGVKYLNIYARNNTNDFFRTITGTLNPDGTTDTTENIRRS